MKKVLCLPLVRSCAEREMMQPNRPIRFGLQPGFLNTRSHTHSILMFVLVLLDFAQSSCVHNDQKKVIRRKSVFVFSLSFVCILAAQLTRCYKTVMNGQWLIRRTRNFRLFIRYYPRVQWHLRFLFVVLLWFFCYLRLPKFNSSLTIKNSLEFLLHFYVALFSRLELNLT